MPLAARQWPPRSPWDCAAISAAHSQSTGHRKISLFSARYQSSSICAMGEAHQTGRQRRRRHWILHRFLPLISCGMTAALSVLTLFISIFRFYRCCLSAMLYNFGPAIKCRYENHTDKNLCGIHNNSEKLKPKRKVFEDSTVSTCSLVS